MFDAINYDDKEGIVSRDAGGIIVATGFELFDPAALPEFGVREDSRGLYKP